MSRLFELSVGPVVLKGDLQIPSDAEAIVVVATAVKTDDERKTITRKLHASRFATLFIDLVTRQAAERNGAREGFRVDVRFQANQLVGVTDWILERENINHLNIGYFATDMATAAAFVAAAERPNVVRAIVTRGGRPDLAGLTLPEVRAPTLLIVGGDDLPTLALSRQALLHLHTEGRLELVTGAGARFEQPEELERVADLADEWFQKHLIASD
jgi:pimeloyl-ACP methyl ester carboxylesterase